MPKPADPPAPVWVRARVHGRYRQCQVLQVSADGARLDVRIASHDQASGMDSLYRLQATWVRAEDRAKLVPGYRWLRKLPPGHGAAALAPRPAE